MPKLKVQLRGGFSDRNNIKPENTTIQTTALDERTRMAIATTTSIVFNGAFYGFNAPYDENIQFFIKHALADVYGVFVDWTKYYSPSEMLKAINETITEDDYDSILTVVEYIVHMIDATLHTKVVFENQYHTASQLYNQVLEREYVGYRIVDYLVAPITNSAEIEAIEEAVSTQYKDVNQHLEKALGFLSDRETPDYANSMRSTRK